MVWIENWEPEGSVVGRDRRRAGGHCSPVRTGRVWAACGQGHRPAGGPGLGGGWPGRQRWLPQLSSSGPSPPAAFVFNHPLLPPLTCPPSCRCLWPSALLEEPSPCRPPAFRSLPAAPALPRPGHPALHQVCPMGFLFPTLPFLRDGRNTGGHGYFHYLHSCVSEALYFQILKSR